MPVSKGLRTDWSRRSAPAEAKGTSIMPVETKLQHSQPPLRGDRNSAPVSMPMVMPQRWIPFSDYFLVIVPCLLVSATALIIALLHGFQPNGDGSSQNVTTVSEQRTNILRLLWNAGNTSLDPCKDFHLYTCHNVEREQISGGQFNILDNPPGLLQGLFPTQAGRLLFIYHRSCFEAQWKPASLGRQAIRAVLSMAYVSPTMSSLQLLAMIVRLNLAYGLHGNIVMFRDKYGSFPSWLLEGALPEHLRTFGEEVGTLVLYAMPTTLITVEDSITLFFGASFADVIEELLAVNINITSAQLTDFGAALDALSDDGLFYENDISILGELVPGVSTRLWKDMVEEHTTRVLGKKVFLSPIENLKQRFSALLDKRRQPVSTAAIVTEAAVSLLLEYSWLPATASESYDFCASDAFQLEPVWVLNELISFAASTEHNDILHNTFDTLIFVIKKELLSALTAEDASSANERLNNMRLVLPYHVYPVDLPLPSLVPDNYFFNVLLVRQWRLTGNRYRPPRGISDAQFRYMGYPGVVASTRYVAVPPSTYQFARLDRTLKATPIAVFGFAMADLLWRLVFHLPWMPASQAALERLRSPDEHAKNGSSQKVNRPHYPLLALKSCIHGLRFRGYTHWNQEIRHWGQWQFTTSQLFFGILVYVNYCFHNQEANTRARDEIYALTQNSAEFLEAFKCPRDRTLS